MLHLVVYEEEVDALGGGSEGLEHVYEGGQGQAASLLHQQAVLIGGLLVVGREGGGIKTTARCSQPDSRCPAPGAR